MEPDGIRDGFDRQIVDDFLSRPINAWTGPSIPVA